VGGAREVIATQAVLRQFEELNLAGTRASDAAGRTH
jgi:hypothetical protein